MTAQKTIARLRAKVVELETVNASLIAENRLLLQNNVKLDNERKTCKTKCEIVLSEKDRLLKDREQRLAACKPTIDHLRNATWLYSLKQFDGGIEIIHTVKFK